MTSAANPIRVDWIPTGLWPGRLGLTFAPGKKGGSVYQPGVTHDRSVTGDMRTLAQQGTTVLAPLIEDFEFDLLGKYVERMLSAAGKNSYPKSKSKAGRPSRSP